MNIKGLKYLLLVLMTFHWWGCSQNDEMQNIIKTFQETQVGDLREIVFQISFEKTGNKRYVVRGETDNAAIKQALLDTLRKEGFQPVDSIVLLPDNIAFPHGVVCLSTANLRLAPKHRAELVNQAIMGTPVKILKEEKSWVYIQTPDHYLAWCEKSALALMDEKMFEDWQNSPRVIMVEPFALLTHAETGLPVSDLIKGSILTKIATQGTHVLVQLPDGREGRLPAVFITEFDSWKKNTIPKPENVKQTALEMSGIPYLWGGTSNKGIDCSGFTKTIYFHNGIILARDASLQVRHGKDIPFSKGYEELQTADLLFFSAHSDSETPITHVGMYLEKGRFLHASGMVRMGSLNPEDEYYDDYNTQRLKFVRRVIGQENTPGIIPVKQHPWY